MSWALFKGDEQISKRHSRKVAAVVEAFERKVVITAAGDWIGDNFSPRPQLLEGYTIREIDA